MTTVAAVFAFEERLQHFFPEAILGSGLMAEVRNKLLDTLSKLKKNIEDAKANQKISDEQVRSYLRKSRKVLYNLEDLMESYVLEVESRRNGFLKRIFRRPIQPKTIEKLQEELAAIVAKPPKPSDTSSQHHGLSEQVPGSIETEDIFQTEDRESKLVEALITSENLELSFVVICGMGGIGKTTLAKKLWNRSEIQSNFVIRIWVTVSDQYQTRDILRKILSGVSLGALNRRESMIMQEVDLAENIYRSLKGQRYMIVLDDVWSADAWFSIRIAFPDNNKGSRILITTRNSEVASRVGGRNSYIHDMRHLTEKQSLDLFMRQAGLDGSNEETKQIAYEIARQVQGTPLAIQVLANALRGRTLRDQREVLQRLVGDKDPNEILNLPSSIYNDLILNPPSSSYNDLSPCLRLCLLYLGNLPEVQEIEMDTVFQLWLAEGLISIEDKGIGETMMDVAARYLERLVKMRFVITINKVNVSGQRMGKSCRIYDHIREFCKKQGKDDEFFADTESGDENQTMSSVCRRAIYLDKYECTDNVLYGNAGYLRCLLFFNLSESRKGYMRPREIPNLDRFIWLRVLYLCGVDFKHGKLPQGIEKLVYLRYLSFRDSYLVELSSFVSNMSYLQTLDLRVRNDCEMTIPDVLGNLKRLKYLYLPLAYRTLDGKKLQLGSLEELEILDNFDTRFCNTDDLFRLTNVLELAITTEGDVSEIRRILDFLNRNSNHMRSTSLNIGNFDCYSAKRLPVMEEVFISSALHALGIEGYLGKLPADKISRELTKIVLNGSELEEDPMQVLQQLPNLMILVLEIEAYTKTIIKCSKSGFPKLGYLKLSKLYNLEEWEVQEGAMRQLSTLVIEDCEKLKELPEGLRFLHNLEKLDIASMPVQFVNKIQMSDDTEVNVDGLPLTPKTQQQGPGEDPQPSSMSEAPQAEARDSISEFS